MAALLELDHLTKWFGQVVVAEDLSFAVQPGDAVGIVGPNGAGKTSVFGIVTGDLHPDSGDIRFDGSSVTRLDPAVRCRLGIGRTYQVPRPFEDMTVFENVLMAAQQGGGDRGGAAYQAAAELVERTALVTFANDRAGRLGLLQRKRLELARSLATRPRLLLLDEVAGGLTDPEMVQLADLVRDALEAGVAVLWVEHVVRALLGTVQRLICLAAGRIIGDGEPTDVLASPTVREVFLGTTPAAAWEGAAEAPSDQDPGP
ncbi:MAG: ABC transporter ATP-binding protein [Actinomycetota bacterium]